MHSNTTYITYNPSHFPDLYHTYSTMTKLNTNTNEYSHKMHVRREVGVHKAQNPALQLFRRIWKA